MNQIIKKVDAFVFDFYLWIYENLIHLFGLLGTVLAIISVGAVFIGNFTLAFCILSLSLGSLLMDKFVKE